MQDENAPSLMIRAAVAAGVLLAVCGVIWWLSLIVTGSEEPTSVASTQRSVAVDAGVDANANAEDESLVPTAPPAQTTRVEPRLINLGRPLLFDDDLGTGSTEFSAVTLNEATNRLVIADDEGQLFEFDLDDDGAPIEPVRRTIGVEVGESDIEGIAWIAGSTYVLADEDAGELLVVDIDDQQQVVTPSDVSRTIRTLVSETDGAGIEGVTAVETMDDVEFIVVVERPPSMRFIDDDGEPVRTIPLRLGVDDVADVWASPSGTVWVVSDLGRVIVRIQVGADGSVRQLQQIDLVFAEGRFEQPEGLVVSSDGERLYVVGESPGPGRFSLGVWSLE